MSEELEKRLQLLAGQMPYESLDGAAVAEAADQLKRYREFAEWILSEGFDPRALPTFARQALEPDQ